MYKVKPFSRFFISCFLLAFVINPNLLKAQTPTKCLEIESILVDACNATSLEPNNEMVRFKVGPTPINISNLIISGAPASGVFQLNKWPTTGNPFLGFIQNATTASLTAALQATVQSSCGHLIEPPAGIIPAGAEVLMITSDSVSTTDNSFATLVGTLYVIYHNEKRTDSNGHFGNTGTGTRSFALIQNIVGGCSDTVVYSPSLLVGGNGATVNYTWPGTAVVTYVNNGCKAPFVVNTANAGTGGAVCPNGTISLNGIATGSYSGVIWQGGQGVFSSPTSLSTNYTAGVTESGAITLSFGVIGYCTDTVFGHVTVTINPKPSMISAGSAIICSGNAVNIALTSSVPSTYSWIASNNANTTGESIVAQTSTTLNNTIISSNITAETISYTVTPTSTTGLCIGTPQTILVTVNPTPTVTNTPLTQTICSGTNTSLVNLTSNVSGANFSWTASATSGIAGFTASGTNTIPVQTITNSGLTSGTVTYAITPSANNCSGPVTNYTITVTPKDNASFTYSSSTYCQTGANPTPSITGLSGGIFSSTAGLNINSSTGTIDLAGSTLGTYPVTYSVNAACPNSSNFNVTITNAPNASFSYSGPYCKEGTNPLPTFSVGASAGVFSSSPAGLFFTNTSTGQIDLTSSAAGTYIVKDSIAAAGGCAVALATNLVTINPTPSVTNNPLIESICSGSTTNIGLTSGVVGTTFNFTASNTSGLVSGFTASATGVTSINDVLSNNTSSIGTITYVITPQTALCTGVSVNYVVTVNPIPTLTNTPLSETICSGVNTNITLTSNITGTTFNFTASNTSGILTGFTASAVGVSSINDIILNNANTAGTITYTIVPNTASCSGLPINYVVTVNPKPTLTNSPLSEIICSGLSTNIVLTSGVSGTTFDYTASNVSNMITGYTNNVNGVVTINDVLSNNSSLTDSVTYLITPNANGCSGTNSIFSVYVNPIPTVSNLTLTETICSGATTTPVNLTSDVAGASFTWTAFCSGSVTGFVSTGTNTIPAQTISNTGISSETVTYSITPSANGCSGVITDYVVTINPLPVISNAPLSVSICSGTSTTPVTFTSIVPGTTYSWTATGTAGITGFAASGTNTIPLQTIFNSGTTSGTVTYTITPFANGCSGNIETFVLTILPLPAVSNTVLSQTICSGGATTIVTLLSNVSGALNSWTAVATPGITGFITSGTGVIPSQIITNTGITVGTITYTITPVANSCIGTSVDYVVTVNPPISITASNNTPICEGNTIILSTATVSGATYNWTGPNSFSSTDQNPVIINASPSMSGTYSLTISVGNCNSTIGNTVVIVNPGAIASFSANPLSGAAPLLVNFTNNSQNATSYLWDFGNGITNTSTSPTETFSLIGIYNVVLIASANSQCPDTTEMTISVYDNFTILIPNVFTPNGDGNNDIFFITGSGIKEFECSIFDRWGLKMKQLNDLNIGWDGRTDSGMNACEGTYYYMIKVKGFDDKPIEKNGFIMLMK